MYTYHVPDEKAFDALAEKLLEQFPEKRLFAFSGELGAGKTTFIQSICRSIGVEDDVNSPSFSLVNEYIASDGESIYHFDCYRIEKIEEMYDIGYEEYFFSDAFCFVEWPEKISELLTEDIVYIKIDMVPEGGRNVSF